LRKLQEYCEVLVDNDSAAIYKFCLYEDLDGKINNKTGWNLSNNFRFKEGPGASYGSPEIYGGNYGQMLQELKELRKELNALKNQAPEEHKLGMIGELMEMEALQPIIMGLANKAADWIMTPGKGVGELKRVSGVPLGTSLTPSPPPLSSTWSWREDTRIGDALDTLAGTVEDLPVVLEQLARMAIKKPGQFKLYKTMLLSMKL